MNTRCVNAYNAAPACCARICDPNDPNYARPSTLNQQRNAVFFGGSLLASGEGFSKQVITKAQYREGHRLRARRWRAVKRSHPPSPPPTTEEEGPRCARSSMAFRFTS
jgi:hypothetical protein